MSHLWDIFRGHLCDTAENVTFLGQMSHFFGKSADKITTLLEHILWKTATLCDIFPEMSHS